MFRPRNEVPPIARQIEPEVKVSWLEVNVIAPITRTLFVSLLSGIAISYFLAFSKTQDPVDGLRGIGLDGITWVILTSMPWAFIFFGGIHALIDIAERVFGVEIDGRKDSTARAAKTPIGHLIIDSWRGQKEAELDARRRERVVMEKFIREAAKNSTTRHLDEVFGSNRKNGWHVWRDRLYEAGYIVLDEPGRKNSTWHLRLGAEETIVNVFAKEVADEQRERDKLAGK